MRNGGTQPDPSDIISDGVLYKPFDFFEEGEEKREEEEPRTLGRILTEDELRYVHALYKRNVEWLKKGENLSSEEWFIPLTMSPPIKKEGEMRERITEKVKIMTIDIAMVYLAGILPSAEFDMLLSELMVDARTQLLQMDELVDLGAFLLLEFGRWHSPFLFFPNNRKLYMLSNNIKV